MPFMCYSHPTGEQSIPRLGKHLHAFALNLLSSETSAGSIPTSSAVPATMLLGLSIHINTIPPRS